MGSSKGLPVLPIRASPFSCLRHKIPPAQRFNLVPTCSDQFAYELGYFWGLGGTLQGLITPEVTYNFPDPQFIFFFINHAGIVAALLYLSFMGLRPVPASLPRVVAATLSYVAAAGLADFWLGTNYGFLAAKPSTASIMDFLAPWPWYIPELVLIGILSLLIYYTPFWVMDLRRRRI